MKKRIISAIVMAIILIPLLILGGHFFAAAVGVIAALAYKEIVNLKKEGYPNIMLFLGFLSLISLVFSNYVNCSIYLGITYQIIAFCILIMLLPVIFFKDNAYTTKDAFYLIGAILLLGISFNTFVILRKRSLPLFVYLLIIPMVTDIFAMLGGKFFGKHKLCPKLSPKKTWEGSIIGLAGGVIISLIFYIIFIGSINITVVMTSIILSIVGQMGDLVMSKVKREHDIKDFSNLIPGHGGILDRLDSVIFVFLTYMFLLIM